MSTTVTAADVIALLKGKYPCGAYAFLEQVCDGTGARANRWADAVAMSVWPSRGYDITGFEVKVSRYDWQKELTNPAKAEQIMQYCHYWYLVVGDEKIVQPGELPSTWGLMAVSGNKLKTITIRFIASRSVIGWLIRFGTMSLFEHTEILSRDGQGWTGAHAWTGVQKRPLDWAGKLIRDYRYEIEVTEAQFNAFHDFMEMMEGRRYNYLLIVGLAFHLRWLALCSERRVDCSQLVIWALQTAGIHPLNVQIGYDGLVTPETLHLSPILIGKRSQIQ